MKLALLNFLYDLVTLVVWVIFEIFCKQKDFEGMGGMCGLDDQKICFTQFNFKVVVKLYTIPIAY